MQQWKFNEEMFFFQQLDTTWWWENKTITEQNLEYGLTKIKEVLQDYGLWIRMYKMGIKTVTVSWPATFIIRFTFGTIVKFFIRNWLTVI